MHHVSKPSSSLPIVVNIDGEHGNGFHLIGLVRKVMDQLDRNGEAYFNKMITQDYYQNLALIDRDLSGIIELETSNRNIVETVSAINREYHEALSFLDEVFPEPAFIN